MTIEWNYIKDKLPKSNTYIEFRGLEDIDCDEELSLIFHITRDLKSKLLHIKKHSESFNIHTSYFDDILDDEFINDRWRYLNNNELMAFL